MDATRIDIYPISYRESRLCRLLILRVRDCQLAGDDQVRCQAAMGMRPIMGIAVVGMSASRFQCSVYVGV